MTFGLELHIEQFEHTNVSNMKQQPEVLIPIIQKYQKKIFTKKIYMG